MNVQRWPLACEMYPQFFTGWCSHTHTHANMLLGQAIISLNDNLIVLNLLTILRIHKLYFSLLILGHLCQYHLLMRSEKNVLDFPSVDCHTYFLKGFQTFLKKLFYSNALTDESIQWFQISLFLNTGSYFPSLTSPSPFHTYPGEEFIISVIPDSIKYPPVSVIQVSLWKLSQLLVI